MCAAALCVAAPQALAAPRYIDDRSSPEQLIESLYNAINRREYARAWDYFSAPPAANFAAFAKGYEQTEDVQLTIGGVTADGAAGSIFYTVPVAIRARDTQGKWSVFAGCYSLRQVNATIQEPPFRPLRIEKASLKATTTDNPDEALPTSCDGTPVPSAEETLKAKVIAVFDREQAVACAWAQRDEQGMVAPESYPISYSYSYEAADTPPHVATLFKFPCDQGAYNTSEIYYLAEADAGIRVLSFAAPDFDIAYHDEDSEKLKALSVRGIAAQATLVNSGYDPATKSISSYSKWRGLGDASSTGTWKFVEGRFVLTDYQVDPTYDGAENLLDVVKDGKMVQIKVP